ncbi:MAG: FliM/FliN family flagellar motor switch protein, partial [Planctomycetota bacterium]
GKNMKMEEVLRIIPGSVLEFEKPYNEPLDILVHDQPIGRGEVVTVGERFGVQVVEIGSVRDIIRKLGGEGEAHDMGSQRV